MRALWILAAVALVLGGCGGNGDSDSDTAPVDDVGAQVAADVSSYTEAFGTGSPDAAWELVSSRCQGEVPEDQYRASVAAAGELYAGLSASDISAEIDGDSAAVDYATSDPAIGPYVAQPWVLEDGRWRWDDC